MRVDPEVDQELRRLAIVYDLVFGTPNQVLRRHFGLDEPGSELGSGLVPSDSVTARTRRLNGRRLARQHELSVAQCYAHIGGTWYSCPTEFPVAFFDNEGYLLFPTQADFAACSELDVQQTVNVYQGIASIPGYVRCEHSHS
ncbi:MAG: hypothetical protein IIA54_06100 [Chloroflexi bacterium]|nr:hypothetical protein [Chloroflexota bacterium]